MLNFEIFSRLRTFAALAFAVAFLCFATPAGYGQATTGQFVGQVTDPSGAIIRGASITVTDELKGVTFQGVSDGVGNYFVLSVPPGIYKVSAEAPGFASQVYQHVELAIDQHAALNFHLKVGSASATVEVTDTPPVLQSQSAEVGTVIGGDAIVDLPLFGRNFYDLTNLVPGVVPGNGSNMNAFNLSVSGQREYSNSIQLDGIESTSNRTQDITVKPNVDSVEEFKVLTAAYNAEFGNAAGGVIAVQTKAGTNSIHGDAYEFFRPPFMAAKQTIPGVSAKQPEPTLRQHNYGGTIGGPIKKDRAFYFFAYEGMKQDDTWNYVTSTIPFSQFDVKPNGDVDFSHMVDPNAGLPGVAGNGKPYPAAGTVDPIFDPNAAVAASGWWATQFPGNIVPASRVSKAGMNTLNNFFPKPNLQGTHNGWFRNFQAHTPEHQDSDQIDSRFDQVITPKDRLYAVAHWSKFHYTAHDAFYGHTAVAGAGDADQGTRENSDTESVSVTYDHIFNPTALNEFRFGYLRDKQDQYSLLNGTDYSTKYGFGNVAIPGFPATIGFPDIYMADGYLTGGSSWKPFHTKDENVQLGDSFTWSRIAHHEFKFGGDLRLLNSHPYFSLFPTGYEYFGSWGLAETAAQAWWGYYSCEESNWCVPNGWNYLGGSDLADMVLGLPLDVWMGLQLTNPHTKSHNLDFYAQDSFKVTPRLTLNYGVRYEFSSPWTEEHNQMANYDLASGNIVLAGRNGVSKGLVDSRMNQFGPRFGFAYGLNPKTVIRGGGGVFFSPENDGREDYFTKNNPFALQYSYSNWEFNVAPSKPQVWPYQLDAGTQRSTAINIPSAGYIQPKNLVNGNLEQTYAIKPKIKTGTVGSYNLAVERQVTRTLSLDVSYVGSIGRHLSYSVGDINADPSIAQGSSNYDGRITKYLGAIQYLTDAGNSSYSALEVKLNQQATHNLSYLVSYTYGHNLDNGPAPFDLGNGNDRPQNPYNLKTEHASSDSDVRQNLVLSGDARLPFGRGELIGRNWNTIMDEFLGGWKLGAIVNMRTGTPVNIIDGDDPKSALAGLRPNVTKDPNFDRSRRSWDKWFDTSAFTVPAPAKGSSYAYGNAGRNLVKGPGYNNIDAQVSKEFTLENRFKLQLRAEAFNLFNSVHYWNPDGDLNSGTFGQITGAGPGRESQLAVKILW